MLCISEKKSSIIKISEKKNFTNENFFSYHTALLFGFIHSDNSKTRAKQCIGYIEIRVAYVTKEHRTWFHGLFPFKIIRHVFWAFISVEFKEVLFYL